MNKRRRTSSIASRQEEDSLDSNEASTSSGPTLKRRKKQSDPVNYFKEFQIKQSLIIFVLDWDMLSALWYNTELQKKWW